MSDHNRTHPDQTGIDGDVRVGNHRMSIPWGGNLLECPGCSSVNVEIVEAEICPWKHDDGRPATDVGILMRCHWCDDTFRLTMFSHGLAGAEYVLTEHWMSKGIWS